MCSKISPRSARVPAADNAVRYGEPVLRVDPDLERIAARLTAAELRAGDDDDEDLFSARTQGAFVDVYSEVGLRRALQEYGVFDDLRARGFGDHELRITRDGHWRHRLEIILADGSRVMDLRLHLQEHKVKDGLAVAVVGINWLLMQHPHAAFSAAQPRLPGQEHPGTGMGRKVQGLLVLLCRRLGRDGLVSVPERFHLAVLYRRIGFSSVSAVDDVGIVAALAAADVAGLDLAQLAWAVERGFVRDQAGVPWVYSPHTLICPVSSRLQRVLRRSSSPPGAAGLTLRVDLDGLRASLANDPVDGVASVR